MNISSLKQLPERAKIVAGSINRLISKKPKLVIDCGPQKASDLMQMTALAAESMQEKLVCCECSMCGYKNR
jgi:hypothetical protein